MSRGQIAFIESNTTGTGRLFARAAVRLGFRPVLLAENPSRYDYADTVDVRRVDTSSRRGLLDSCHLLQRRAPLIGVTSTSDYFVGIAASIARALRLPGPRPSAMSGVRDKGLQRARLADAGVEVPRFRCVRSARAAVDAAVALGLPVVVKPVRGSGSVGVTLCRTTGEVAERAGALLRVRMNERGQPLPRRILIEEFLVGREYSVETFNRSIIGVTTKHLGTLPAFVETGHDHPSTLPASRRERLHDITRRALDALGLGWGPAHVEVRWTARGPRIVEVNPRLAGGHIPALVRLASGLDLIDASVRLVAGREPLLPRPFRRHASIRFLLPPEDGTFTSTRGLTQARRLPGVVQAQLYRQPGHVVRRQGDFRDRIGHVIAVAATAPAARLAAEQARRAIDIRIRQERAS